MYTNLYIYTFIHTYKKQEREIDKETEREKIVGYILQDT